MTDLVKIPFHGDELLAVDIEGRPFIVLKPAFESIGLDADRQIRKMQAQPWATTAVTAVVAADGKKRQMTAADVRTFLMALATISTARVAEDARPKLVAYQSEVADVIEQYWTTGGAINPRATDDQLIEIARRAEARARVLRLMDGLVDPDWLEAKARHVAAQALGEEPEVDSARRPLTTGEYLEERGITGEALRRMSPTFGKRVKAAFRDTTGVEPPKVERFVGGALRKVAGYTEQHRSLFDTVFDEMTGT